MSKYNRQINFLGTKQDHNFYKLAAKKAGLSVAEWMRSRLMYAVTNELCEKEIMGVDSEQVSSGELQGGVLVQDKNTGEQVPEVEVQKDVRIE